MDRVKLGRALGYGTRHAAKTLAAVAEAAAAPGPHHLEQQTTSVPAAARNRPSPRPAAQRNPHSAQARVAGRSVLAPLATFSTALWLRVTGCFFALVALTMAGGAWRGRGALQPGAGPHILRHFWLFFGFAALFSYFAVSSFVRASLRERRGSTIATR